jgi:hypothetical protein
MLSSCIFWENPSGTAAKSRLRLPCAKFTTTSRVSFNIVVKTLSESPRSRSYPRLGGHRWQALGERGFSFCEFLNVRCFDLEENFTKLNVILCGLGVNPSSMIALQSVGGNLGNMIALGNIVLVCSWDSCLEPSAVLIVLSGESRHGNSIGRSWRCLRKEEYQNWSV